jgi:hypothetical protein
MIKRSDFPIVFSFVLLLAGSFFFSGCESSRVGPEVTINTPPPAAAPLVLQGSVYNSKTNSGVSGATVGVFKPDGTTIALIATNTSGNFSYDVSTLTNTSYKISATASGFGSAFTNAKVDPANRTADIVSIPLDPVVSVSVNLTPTGGTAGGSVNTESKSGGVATLTVPANAVTSNTAISVSTPQVNNVPLPTSASTTAQVGVTNLTPAGITFAKAVNLSYPLPYQFKAGDLIPVMELVSGNWQVSTFNATVDNAGYTASMSLTKTGQFALFDNAKISGTVNTSIQYSNENASYPPMLKATQTLETRSFSLGGSNVTAVLPNIFSWTKTVSNQLLDPPTDEWIFNTLTQRYGTVFALSAGSGTQTVNGSYLITWPGVPVSLTVNNSGSGNAEFPNDTGSWSLIVSYETVTTTFATVQIDNPGKWTINITGSETSWREQSGSRQWKWTGHNQGKIYTGF